jgi:O-acetyl-ADP-ribose deacetylase (regulator of RNase III)
LPNDASNARIETARGDITKIAVKAIVNAANEDLRPGGGVDGAIRRAAGPGIDAECRRVGGCPTGEARITGGYDLPADWVIHTAGPVWRGGGDGEDRLLESCYRSCLALAAEKDIRSIAFPAISTGIYGFPRARAARIAVATTRDFLAAPAGLPERIVFVSFSAADHDIMAQALAEPG